jgi:hypothetical protein
MEKKHKFAMLASIVHIANADWSSLVIDLVDMDIIRPETDLRQVQMVFALHTIQDTNYIKKESSQRADA